MPSDNASPPRKRPLKINDLLRQSSATTTSNMTPSNTIQQDQEQDLLMAAQALGQLRQSQSPPSTSNSLSGSESSSEQEKPVTILDKMTSYPLISNSINYMLEKTISTSNNYVKEDVSTPSSTAITPTNSSNSTSSTPTSALAAISESTALSTGISQYPSEEHFKRSRTSISYDHSTTFKRPKLQSKLSSSTTLPPLIPQPQAQAQGQSQPQSQSQQSTTIAPLPPRFPRNSTNLRQHVTVSSAISAQQSLQDLRDLSVINLNIESRKRVTMLINFLKMGNSQLSERIESLINLVDSERERKLQQLQKQNSNTSDPFNSRSPTPTSDNRLTEKQQLLFDVDDIPIQQLKNEIVTTVKKIVNVVSKVSANSLPEPARSHVREILLKLPANWATMFEQQLRQQEGSDDQSDDDLDSDSDLDDDDDDDVDVDDDDDDSASIDTRYEDSVEDPTELKKQNNGRPVRKQHIAQRLLMNLFKYKPKTTPSSPITHQKSSSSLSCSTTSSPGGPSGERSWFKRTIRKQIQKNDPNGKILILCQESLDMINNIIKFCNENLQKAESWNLKQHEKLNSELVSKLNYMNAYTENEGVEKIVVKEDA